MCSVRGSESVKTELKAIIATLADLGGRSMYDQDQIIINSVVLVAILRSKIPFKSIAGKQNRGYISLITTPYMMAFGNETINCHSHKEIGSLDVLHHTAPVNNAGTGI
jgi:hypothetical protein